MKLSWKIRFLGSNAGDIIHRQSIGREIREFWCIFYNLLIIKQLKQKLFFLIHRNQMFADKSIGFEVQNHSSWTVKPMFLKHETIGFAHRNVSSGNESLHFYVSDVQFFNNRFLFQRKTATRFCCLFSSHQRAVTPNSR